MPADMNTWLQLGLGGAALAIVFILVTAFNQRLEKQDTRLDTNTTQLIELNKAAISAQKDIATSNEKIAFSNEKIAAASEAQKQSTDRLSELIVTLIKSK